MEPESRFTTVIAGQTIEAVTTKHRLGGRERWCIQSRSGIGRSRLWDRLKTSISLVAAKGTLQPAGAEGNISMAVSKYGTLHLLLSLNLKVDGKIDDLRPLDPLLIGGDLCLEELILN